MHRRQFILNSTLAMAKLNMEAIRKALKLVEA